MTPKLSIIIPCYNAELTLELTLRSVQEQKYQDWEVIIVNDGSTDDTEKLALSWVEKDQRFKYYSKHNEGLGKTRNFGISHSIGEYILPLDADNLVAELFAQKAISFLDCHSEFGVFHGNAQFFGEKKGVWKMGRFNLYKLLINNYIDACAIYRRKLWDDVNGYDENMPYQGYEDWDFWIKLGGAKVNFYFLNEITFEYFVSSKSMINSFSEEMHDLNVDFLVKKHSKLYYKCYREKFNYTERIQNKFKKITKTVRIVTYFLRLKKERFSLF